MCTVLPEMSATFKIFLIFNFQIFLAISTRFLDLSMFLISKNIEIISILTFVPDL